MGELQMGKEAKPLKMQQDTRQNRKSEEVSLVLRASGG